MVLCVYHYFETKDGLFLACVAECFQRLTSYIRENMREKGDAEHCLEEYFAIRTRFFRAHPVYQRIFCEAVISPPAHLRIEIQTYRQDFDALNIQILERLLAPLALLAKAVYNLVDTAYIEMLGSDIALTAVGVTVPLLLIMVSIENIFAAGAAVTGLRKKRSSGICPGGSL